MKEQSIPIEQMPLVTVMANGAKAVGRVFVREPGCVFTDDVIGVTPLCKGLDVDYLAVALRSAVAAGGFLYEAKLFVTRVRGLSVSIPTTPSGGFDLDQQRAIAAAMKRFDSIT